MIDAPKSRDLACRLLAWEADAGETSEPMKPVALRVYEKLRRRLSALAGVAGFQSLALRALSQAKLEASGLLAVEVAPDGSLHGLGEAEPPVDVHNDSAGEEGAVLITRLLGLLLIFLGEALTLNLISDLWPDATLDDRNSRHGRKA